MMLLPLLLLLLFLLYVLYHVLIWEHVQQKQQRQQHKNLLWQFIQLNIPMSRDVMGYMIQIL